MLNKGEEFMMHDLGSIGLFIEIKEGLNEEIKHKIAVMLKETTHFQENDDKDS